MFTGLVQAVGRVLESRGEAAGGMSLQLVASAWTACPLAGDSISVDGCCLTVVQVAETPDGGVHLTFDLVQQTLDLTTLGDCQAGDSVNLECAATPGTLLGGHLVQGHVDGVGEIQSVQQQPGDVRLSIQAPPGLAELIVPQGSITVAGVSLTVADVSGRDFDVVLVPTTLERTTLGTLATGDRVNLESDILLRSVRHLLAARGLLGDAVIES